MAFNIRLFGYRGIIQVQQRLVQQFTGDTVFLTDDPYVWTQLLVSNLLVPVESAVVNGALISGGDVAQLVRLEIPDGQSVRYEVNPNGPTATTHRAASANSPIKSGIDYLPYSPGYSYSFIDASGT